jgi:hypothetical protein
MKRKLSLININIKQMKKYFEEGEMKKKRSLLSGEYSIQVAKHTEIVVVFEYLSGLYLGIIFE